MRLDHLCLKSGLHRPVDVAGLVFFRMAFGAVLVWEVVRLYQFGWIRAFWLESPVHFGYLGFGWVEPLPAPLMYLLVAIIGLAAALVGLGLAYRTSLVIFGAGFTYLFLLEQGRYLNHFYLICLLSLLLLFVPAHRRWSVDALRCPGLRSDTAPAWTLWILRAQLGIVYFYGGLAKLNADWFAGEPMRLWMSERSDFPLIGAWFTEEWMVYLFSYGGLLLDLLIVPALLWKPTRAWAFALATLFHLTNAWLFPIGIFPWFMIAATTLFLSPDWPRRLVRRWRAPRESAAAVTAAPADPLARPRRAVAAFLIGYFAVQLVVPFRHLAYPGDASWTEEGHLFAWRMKLREKRGRIRFVITDPESGATWINDPYQYLPAWQARVMSYSPDLILQYAHHVRQQMQRSGYPRVVVRAQVAMSLNGREPRWLVDPDVDLAAVRRSVWPATWIHSEPTVRELAVRDAR